MITTLCATLHTNPLSNLNPNPLTLQPSTPNPNLNPRILISKVLEEASRDAPEFEPMILGNEEDFHAAWNTVFDNQAMNDD